MRGYGWIAVLVGLVVAGAVAYGVFLAVDTDEAEEDAVELQEILEEPERYDGQTVTVVAAVGAVLSPQSFVLGGESPQEGLLVVVDLEDVVDLEAEAGEVVRATGDLEILEAGLKDELVADLALEEEEAALLDRLAGEPLLVASVVESEVTEP